MDETELRINEVTAVLNMVIQGMHVTHHIAASALGQLYRGAYAHMLADYTNRPDLVMPTYAMVCEKFDQTNLDCAHAVEEVISQNISQDATLINVQEDNDLLN